MGYPRLVNWVGFKKTENGKYIIKDFVCGDQYAMEPEEVRFVRQLDGTVDPYEIETSMSEEEVTELLEALDYQLFLREGNFLAKKFSETLYTLWVPRITKGMKVAARIINLGLAVTWLPVLILSLVLADNADIAGDPLQMVFGYFFGLFAGMVLHELGHMLACVSYGGRVFEVGVMLIWLIPGAYVLMDTSNIKKRMRKVQINAAGVEMNFFLTGIFGIVSCLCDDFSGFFYGAAFDNLILGLMNLILTSNLDGLHIISNLLGIEDFTTVFGKAMLNKRFRHRIVDKGVSGKATMTACGIICAMQLVLPVIIVVNILGVVLCFV